MPIFRPRTRVEILREMIARVVARSTLVGLTRNSVIYHALAAAADEDADQYWQLSKLRKLFSIYTATGSDLDERAAEIAPGIVKRRRSVFSGGDLTFRRQGTIGNLPVPIGTIVAAEDEQGQIKFRTTAAATITAGNNQVVGVPCVALEAGARGNAAAGTIRQLVTRVPGIVAVDNPATFTPGQDRESDDSFRARLQLYVQSLSRGTPVAVRAFALGVQLTDGRRVLFARVVEPILPTGNYDVYIDDGTGTVDEYDDTYLGADDTLINPAVGGEINLFTAERPIRDDGTFQLFIGGVLQVRGTAYELNSANGQVELTAPLTAGANVTARYRHYTGLVQETQRVIDGDPATFLTHPGVRAAGTRALVRPAVAVQQTLAAAASVRNDFDTAAVIVEVVAAVQGYINGLDIGEPVIVSEIIERAMAVQGMYNFQITDLSGTSGPPVDQLILSNQVARIVNANINIT